MGWCSLALLLTGTDHRALLAPAPCGRRRRTLSVQAHDTAVRNISEGKGRHTLVLVLGSERRTSHVLCTSRSAATLNGTESATAKLHRSFYGTTAGRGPPMVVAFRPFAVVPQRLHPSLNATWRGADATCYAQLETRPLRHFFWVSAEKRPTGD